MSIAGPGKSRLERMPQVLSRYVNCKDVPNPPFSIGTSTLESDRCVTPGGPAPTRLPAPPACQHHGSPGEHRRIVPVHLVQH